jgi:hypothetical protein
LKWCGNTKAGMMSKKWVVSVEYPDAFWDEVIRCNTEAFNRRILREFYREKFFPLWQSPPWYARAFIRCCAWVKR